IDSFVNAIYLFDDYLVITFNYKEGTKTITFAEIEEAFGSDLSSLTAPEKSTCNRKCFFLFYPAGDFFPTFQNTNRQRRENALR
ncbi:MAG: recombinase family protein, partial [Clostridia bacterium]|nr:recombinase family protein [Clostridia bacterium]